MFEFIVSKIEFCSVVLGRWTGITGFQFLAIECFAKLTTLSTFQVIPDQTARDIMYIFLTIMQYHNAHYHTYYTYSYIS